MTLPGRYGLSSGGYKLIQGQELVINLSKSGMNVAVAPAQLPEAESPNATDVHLSEGGVGSAFGLTDLGTAFNGVTNKTIIGIAEFTKKAFPGNNRLVRFRPNGWDRWDGAGWVSLGGALNGSPTDRVYSVVMQDKLLVANKVDQLSYWDGLDATPITNLSIDAPVPWFITPFGNRLVAARLKLGSETDPYAIKWSADGNITNWTSANLGAGTGTLEPEGRGGGPDYITGLATIETAMVVFRQRSLVLAVRTGIGSQPFRFNTVVHGLGTDAPYSIANAGHAVGVIFLGSDLNFYLFNGQTAPVAIGDPIRSLLRSQVSDPALCVGAMDLKRLEYWCLIKRNNTLPDVAWVFDVAAYAKEQRLSWRRRDILEGLSTVAFGRTDTTLNEVVDNVGLIVETVPTRVNEYGAIPAPERIMFGNNQGVVKFADESKFLQSGVWESRMIGNAERDTMLDRCYLMVSSTTGAFIEISISTDGGTTWGEFKSLTIPVTNYPRSFGTWFNLVVNTWQFRLRLLQGQATISEIRTNVGIRGPAGA
jgi:hypothetical protein